jgi:hypothetical protein
MPALDHSLQKRDVGSTLRTSLHFAFVPIGDIEIGLVTTQLGKRGGIWQQGRHDGKLIGIRPRSA